MAAEGRAGAGTAEVESQRATAVAPTNGAGGGTAVATAVPAERRRKVKKFRGYRNIPWLDYVLTTALAGSALAVLRLLEQDDLLLLLLSSLGTVLVLNGTKRICRALAPLVGTASAVSKPRNVQKFADQGWQLVVHVAMVALEVAILTEEGWKTYHDPKLAWVELKPTLPLTRSLYLTQLGVWLYTTFSHRFLEARHKDYYVMYLHHIATIFLVLGSYTNSFTKIGVLILFVHDASDIFVDLLKMANYTGLDSTSGLYLTEVVFAMNLVSWAASRLWIFPVKLVWSAWFESVVVWGELQGRVAGANPLVDAGLLLRHGRLQDSVLRVALVILVLLHAWWYFLFLRILVKLLRGTNTHTRRDEYEGASSETDGEKAR